MCTVYIREKQEAIKLWIGFKCKLLGYTCLQTNSCLLLILRMLKCQLIFWLESEIWPNQLCIGWFSIHLYFCSRVHELLCGDPTECEELHQSNRNVQAP